MKAVAYQQCLPIAHAESLLDVDLPEPAPGPHDLLVEIRAVAANPLDTKMRAQAQPAPGHCKVLGWDASGIVDSLNDGFRETSLWLRSAWLRTRAVFM